MATAVKSKIVNASVTSNGYPKCLKSMDVGEGRLPIPFRRITSHEERKMFYEQIVARFGVPQDSCPIALPTWGYEHWSLTEITSSGSIPYKKNQTDEPIINTDSTKSAITVTSSNGHYLESRDKRRLGASEKYKCRPARLNPHSNLVIPVSNFLQGKQDPNSKNLVYYYSLPQRTRWLLEKLYQSSLREVANLPINGRSPLEFLIIKWRDGYGRQIANEIGMYLPPNSTRIEDYILQNLIAYRSVVERKPGLILPALDIPATLTPKYLSQFRDLEIFISLGVFFTYHSRGHLLERVSQLLVKPGFFRPLNNGQALYSPINRQTTLLTDITDQSIFTVAFGTLSQYRVYELEELDHAFRFILPETDSEVNVIEEVNLDAKSELGTNLSIIELPDNLTLSGPFIGRPAFDTRPCYPENYNFINQPLLQANFNQLQRGNSNQFRLENRLSRRRTLEPFFTPIIPVFTPDTSMQLASLARNDHLRSLPNIWSESSRLILTQSIMPRIILSYHRHNRQRHFLADTDQRISTFHLTEFMMDSISTEPIGPYPDAEYLDNISAQLDNSYRIPEEYDYEEKVEAPLIFPQFFHPENSQQEFTGKELTDLSSLIAQYFLVVDVPEECNHLIEQLLSKISIRKELWKAFNLNETLHLQAFESFSDADKQLGRLWFLELFNAGMYMRKWKGPGEAYPLLEGQTLISSSTFHSDLTIATLSSIENYRSDDIREEEMVDPIHVSQTLLALGLLGELEMAMSVEFHDYLHSLPSHNLIRGRINSFHRTLQYHLEMVTTKGVNDDDAAAACIRINSTIFIGSAYFYLMRFYREKIPDFQASLLDDIS